MSYNLHIIREDKTNKEISYDEVIKLVSESNEFELRDEMKIENPNGEVIKIQGKYIIWKKEEFDVWWNYNRGKISSGYIDGDGIDKLKKVANKLKAKVVGDEGEEY